MSPQDWAGYVKKKFSSPSDGTLMFLLVSGLLSQFAFGSGSYASIALARVPAVMLLAPWASPQEVVV
jgi:hypothetical protein